MATRFSPQTEVRVRHVRAYRRRPGPEGGTTTRHEGPVASFRLDRPTGDAPHGERTVVCPHCGADVAIELRSAPAMRRLQRTLTAALAASLAVLTVAVIALYGTASGGVRVACGLAGALALVTAAYAAVTLGTEKGAEVARAGATYTHPSGTALPEEDQFHVLA